MKTTLNDVYVINGNSSGDTDIAENFCQECAAEAQTKADFVVNTLNGFDLANSVNLGKATDAMKVLAHLQHLADTAAKFHQNGQLRAQFNNLVPIIQQHRTAAKAAYDILVKF